MPMIVPAGYCRCCGKLILSGQERSVFGAFMYCAPHGSPCHAMGRKSALWRLSECEAAALLAADVLAAQQQQEPSAA